jgi:FkbM family methyltransferase
VRWHIQAIEKYFFKFLLKCNSTFFVIGFRIISKLRRGNIKLEFDSFRGCYKITPIKPCVGGGARYVHNRNLLFVFFRRGFKECAKQIELDYLLNQINFSIEPIVIDCGANIGNLELYLSLRFEKYSYFAFEPEKSAYDCLTLNTKNSVCYNVALGDKNNDFQKFYSSPGNGDSSVVKPLGDCEIDEVKLVRADQYKPFIEALKSLGVTEKQHRIETSINVNPKTSKNSVIDLIKLESEGFELESIQGFGSLIKLTRYISTDVGFENNDNSTLPVVTNYLLAHGFEVLDVGYPRLTLLFKNKFMS